MKYILLALSLFPLIVMAQPGRSAYPDPEVVKTGPRVYVYETHFAYIRGEKMLKRYAREFIAEEKGRLCRDTDNTKVPTEYKNCTVREDDKGIYIDVVIVDYTNTAPLKTKPLDGIVTYGTFAFLFKGSRVRLELRNVYYEGGNNKTCGTGGTLEDMINCIDKVNNGGEKIYDYYRDRLYDFSAKFKDFLVETNGRKDDELTIGDDW